MIATKGSVLTMSVEMFTPASCSAVAIDSEIPNRNDPKTTHSGFPPLPVS